jgi:hypothetical protein
MKKLVTFRPHYDMLNLQYILIYIYIYEERVKFVLLQYLNFLGVRQLRFETRPTQALTQLCRSP